MLGTTQKEDVRLIELGDAVMTLASKPDLITTELALQLLKSWLFGQDLVQLFERPMQEFDWPKLGFWRPSSRLMTAEAACGKAWKITGDIVPNPELKPPTAYNILLQSRYPDYWMEVKWGHGSFGSTPRTSESLALQHRSHPHLLVRGILEGIANSFEYNGSAALDNWSAYFRQTAVLLGR